MTIENILSVENNILRNSAIIKNSIYTILPFFCEPINKIFTRFPYLCYLYSIFTSQRYDLDLIL